ncbi:hypothetical protein RBSH_02333 [Rhodopirellula baltica SH28]|uniref:Uncharacterized protein n=1 Tax=Rhodopirellula baltica SH28 TaxID=993517 RepID=K5D6G6_RHOBT|nr:hypothetical protein RBSH_02333 [Rhodopirellula baltica SH28]
MRDAHPELGDAVESVDLWMQSHPHREFLDARAITRDLGNKLTSSEIYSFFKALKELGLAKPSYRIIDPHGSFTRSHSSTLDELPRQDVDQFGEAFAVKRENIVLVFSLEP